MKIRLADSNDLEFLKANDVHISNAELENSVRIGRIYVSEEDGRLNGWLRYGLFWDSTPFMNMLFILKGDRGKGCGRRLVLHWEKKMKKRGYVFVMTSTPSDETSQHFYVKLGYKAAGGFMPESGPFELILTKTISPEVKRE